MIRVKATLAGKSDNEGENRSTGGAFSAAC
jgi:hypothetical protein